MILDRKDVNFELNEVHSSPNVHLEFNSLLPRLAWHALNAPRSGDEKDNIYLSRTKRAA